MINAKTSEKLAGVDVDSFKKVRVNNALRSAIEAALGALTLANPDPQERIAAAEAVFKSRDVKALPALEAQLAKETDRAARPRRCARRAPRSWRSIASAPAADRLAAIAALKERGDQDAQSLLDQVAAKTDDRRAQERGASGARFDQDAPGAVERRAEPLVRRLGRLRCCCSPRSASPSHSA